MKRKTIDFDNSVDGKEIKKIKKLTFLLAEDEKTELDQETTINVSRNVRTKINNNSDDESNDSDVESELSFHDDNETMNEEDSLALERFLKPEIVKDVVEGMVDAKREVAELLNLEEVEEFDWNSVEGLAEHEKLLKELMINYKKGRNFPKTVKVLPQIPNWQYIMERLDFPAWSSSAVQAMTKQIIAKGGDGVGIFYKFFLLPYVRENIAKNKKKLDNVLYKTLQDCLFRRKEFMVHILLPWCNDNMNGTEAEVLSSVLKNSTVKCDVAAPAMNMIMLNMPFSRETLMILRAFLDKKYDLPYETINTFVDYFYRPAKEDFSNFYTEGNKMPLLWFQTLNLFVSLYYPNINEDATKKLRHLCRVHFHDKITDATRGYLKMVTKPDNMIVD